MSEHKVVVIGGGVIGAACAYYLARAGHRVTVVDQGGFGLGCSHANCGLITPSHVLPLAVPGVVGKGLRWMLRRDAPLRIRAWLDPGLWGWLYRFARAAKEPSASRAARGRQALLQSSFRLLEQLLADEPLRCEYERRGCLFVFRSDSEMRAYSGTDLLLQDFGLGAQRLAGPELQKFEPTLRDDLAGGWFYPGDAQLSPEKLMASWRGILERIGVLVEEHCQVSGFRAEGDRARCVDTDRGPVQGDTFVLAAGSMAARLGKGLGCRIPIQPGKGYSITTTRPKHHPLHAMIFQEDKVAVTPLQSGLRVGSLLEFSGFDATLPPRRIETLREGARRHLKEPLGSAVKKAWFGWRPMTPDGLPIIDFSPALPNVVIAAGHNMVGVSMATGTGKLVAQLIGGEPPHIDPRPYSVQRFR